jgi:hypothetical protein
VTLDPDATVDVALRRALDGYTALTELGEEVEDEWTYAQDLAAAWRGRLEEVAAERDREPIDAPVAAAIEAVVAEIGRITDPHRAIDWLSTFPQVVLIALGERP